jgi:hypothetical protein
LMLCRSTRLKHPSDGQKNKDPTIRVRRSGTRRKPSSSSRNRRAAVIFAREACSALPRPRKRAAARLQAVQDIKRSSPSRDERNGAISSERVPCENVIAMLKRFKIIADRYRNRRQRFRLLLPHRRNLQHGTRARMTYARGLLIYRGRIFDSRRWRSTRHLTRLKTRMPQSHVQ